MKNYILFLIATFLLAGYSCQQKQEITEEYKNEAKQKIAEVSKLYLEAWKNEDLDSVMTFLDEGFLNMFSFGYTQTKEECSPVFRNVWDTYSVEDLEYKSLEIFVDQNYAFETGAFKQKWITNDKQDTIYFDMRGMNVFKKQEDGSWKLFRSMGQQ
ncbi:MAG TPA: nuclear transport factor 2 family protein [Draconibacterium sp.]|nr:nuclear transport factor 2 family protein [Draconibacterium sp.]